jgi:hypothetical protein
MLPPSRLHVLNYCWKCKLLKMDHFSSHIYTECFIQSKTLSFQQPKHNKLLSDADDIFGDDSDDDYSDDEYSRLIIDTINSYLEPLEIEELTSDSAAAIEDAESIESFQLEESNERSDIVLETDSLEIESLEESESLNAESLEAEELNSLSEEEDLESFDFEEDTTISFDCYTKQLPDLATCAICLTDDIKSSDAYYLNCNHGFCKTCVSDQISNGRLNCALCREKIQHFFSTD